MSGKISEEGSVHGFKKFVQSEVNVEDPRTEFPVKRSAFDADTSWGSVIGPVHWNL